MPGSNSHGACSRDLPAAIFASKPGGCSSPANCSHARTRTRSFEAYKSELPNADENKLRLNAQNVERLVYASAETEVCALPARRC